jgi:2-methylcitrate dehydratase
MVYIVGTLLRKAVEKAAEMKTGKIADGNDAMWKTLFLAPYDYDPAAIVNKTTRAFMEKMTFEHGGAEYDRNYPDGIPTSVVITTTDGRTLDSGFVMYPSGHARNTSANLKDILANKFERRGTLAMDDPKPLVAKLNAIEKLDAKQLAGVYDFRIVSRGKFE